MGRTSSHDLCFEAWRKKWSPLPEAFDSAQRGPRGNATPMMSGLFPEARKLVIKGDKGARCGGAHL